MRFNESVAFIYFLKLTDTANDVVRDVTMHAVSKGRGEIAGSISWSGVGALPVTESGKR